VLVRCHAGCDHRRNGRERPVETVRVGPNAELVNAVTSVRKTVWKVGLFIAGAWAVQWFR
jgi:hypothetical protein